jgi:hypothetical protein
VSALSPASARNREIPKPRRILPGVTVSVTVSFVANVDDFYVQLAEEEQDLATLQAQITEFYQGGRVAGMRVGAVGPGQLVCAVFEDDQQLYRARVIRALGGGMVRVHFVDYGNSTDVPWHNIFKLADEFLHTPQMVISVEVSH